MIKANAAMMDPAIPTGLHPNLLIRALATGAVKQRLELYTDMRLGRYRTCQG